MHVTIHKYCSLATVSIIISCWMSTSEGTIWAFAAPVVLVLLVSIATKLSSRYLTSKHNATDQCCVPDNGAGGAIQEGQAEID